MTLILNPAVDVDIHRVMSLQIQATTPVEIHYFEDPREFLSAHLAARKAKNPNFSIRSWSRQLGMSNPTLLARILKGERPITLEMAQKITRALRLSQDQGRFFEVLVLLARSKSIGERELYLDLLARLKPRKDVTSLTVDRFRMIRDWYHSAILEMVSLKGFDPDPKWIAKRLGRGVTPELTESAVQRLVRLGLLEKDSKGSLRRLPLGRVKIGDEIPSEAVREYHRQMLDLAKESLDDSTMKEREIRALTLAIKKENYPKLVKVIRQAISQLGEIATTEESDQVYQVNMAAFELCKKGNPQ